MAIDISKILTISASEYVESKSRKLSDYKYLGVHLNTFEGIKDFSDKVPGIAEVVVGYFVTSRRTFELHRGTALIPKSGLEKEAE